MYSEEHTMFPRSILPRQTPPALQVVRKQISTQPGVSYTPPYCPQCPLPCVPNVPESKSCWPFVVVRPMPAPVDPCDTCCVAPCMCVQPKQPCPVCVSSTTNVRCSH